LIQKHEEAREAHRVAAGDVCYLLRVDTNGDEAFNSFLRSLQQDFAKSPPLCYKVERPYVVDQIDRAILRELVKDSRLSVKELCSRMKNLTYRPIERRVRNLENEKIILKYTIDIDPHYVIPKKVAYVAVLPPIQQDFLDFTRECEEVQEVQRVSEKDACYLLRVETADDTALQHFLEQLDNRANSRLYIVTASWVKKCEL
jgi:Lrp/AsnC family transcriptional regulator, leucine-responsive regulatory protein